MIPRPQNHDYVNTQSSIVDVGLNDPVGVSWQLFHDENFTDLWKEHQGTFSFLDFRCGYDGAILFVEAVWPKLKHNRDVFGIQLSLPNGASFDQTGFYWMFDNSSKSYSQHSYFHDGVTKTTIQDKTWICNNVENNDERSQIGWCYNFLPKKNKKFCQKHRFESGDLIQPSGWTIINNKFSSYSLYSGSGIELLGSHILRSHLSVFLAAFVLPAIIF